MRDYSDTLMFAPRLPARLNRLCFGLAFRGSRLRVEVRAGEATYDLIDGEALELIHHGERVTVTPGASLTLPVPPPPQFPTPRAPAGREPGLQPPGAGSGVSP
jgi:alpha,alpha-trehalose phosphorylase